MHFTRSLLQPGTVATRLAAVALIVTPLAFAADHPMSLAEVKAMIGGGMKGGTTCGSRIGTSFKVDAVTPAAKGFAVSGSYQTYALGGADGGPPHQEAPWTGVFDSQTGILQMKSGFPAAKDPNACPPGFGSVFGTKMDCKVDYPFKKQIEERNAKAAAELAMASQFVAVVGPDGAGTGWRGTLINPAFDCPEVALAQESGAGPRGLPPISGSTAYEQAEYFMRNGNPQTAGSARVYWLKMAAAQGHRDANAYLGRTYELGEGAPQDFTLAATYYRVAAEAGDSRAQNSLSRMLAEGRGEPVDLAASQRWARMAKDTRDKAARICVAQPTVAAFEGLMIASLRDPAAQLTTFLGGMFLGVQIEPGTIRIIDVKLDAVSSIDQPFLCEVTARRVGMTLTNIKPDWVEVRRTDDGYVVLRDQRGAAAMNEALANGVTALARTTPWIQSFRVSAQDRTQYKLTMMPQLIALARPYEMVVDIDAVETPRSAPPRPITATPAPSPMTSPAPPTAQTEPGAVQLDALVNAKLVEWSSSWYSDRYLAGSAHISKRECSPNGCKLSGAFTFVRYGSPLTIPLFATSFASEGQYRLTQLCYVDTSTGQQACTQ